MQWLTLVTEDAGVQRLKADNRQPVVTRGVDAVPQYPVTHAPSLGEQQVRKITPRGERRAGDRRQGERRQQQVPVLLDTRCGNRRAIENRRRAAASADGVEAPLASINLYA